MQCQAGIGTCRTLNVEVGEGEYPRLRQSYFGAVRDVEESTAVTLRSSPVLCSISRWPIRRAQKLSRLKCGAVGEPLRRALFVLRPIRQCHREIRGPRTHLYISLGFAHLSDQGVARLVDMFFHQALNSHGVPDFERPGDLLVIVKGDEPTLVRIPVVRTVNKWQARNGVDDVLQ